MFLFVLPIRINSHLINTTANKDSFLKVCIMVNYMSLLFPFLSAWVMGAARISGFWQINIFQIKASNISFTIFPCVLVVLFYAG